MGISVWYWLIMFLWLIGALWGNWAAASAGPAGWRPVAWIFPLFILFCLIGWHLFGSPVKG